MENFRAVLRKGAKMSKVTIIHDCKRLRKDGTAPLKMVVRHGDINMQIAADMCIMPGQWNPITSEVVAHPRRRQMNEYLKARVINAEMIIQQLRLNGRRITAEVLRKCIETGDADAGSTGFMEFYRQIASDETKSPRTREIYEATRKKLVKYAADTKVNPEYWTFEDITRTWVSKFDKWLMATSPSRNARNIHIRNIRHVCNEAVAEHLTSFYDFKAVHLKYDETPKRSLTVEQLRAFFALEVEPYQVKYHDMFKLIFYLIGINTIDLCHLKKENIREGRLEYRRSKTSRLYSIKLEPEAIDIINRYAGDGDWLLDILDRYKNFKDYTHRLNENLQVMGNVEIGKHGKKTRNAMFPELTTYWARHSWATIAASLDIPNETIAAALGHTYGNKITSIYINFDQSKVDVANRRMLDWVLYGKKENRP